MQETPRSLEILAALCRHPATSYFEDKVAREVERILTDAEIPYEQDDYGNIIARLTRRNESPGHPELVDGRPAPKHDQPDRRRLTLKMLGRVSDVIYEQQVDLVVHCADGSSCAAQTTGQDSDPEARVLYADLVEQNELVLPAFAVFDLVDYELGDTRIFARALDDLAGCATTLSILETLVVEDGPVDVIGVFTCAEEEGLIGARLLAAAGSLPKETLVVSIESSRTLPGAEQGNGPVIRVGDALSTFSQSAETVLQAARATLQRRDPPIPVQRQLMSGGVCEASVFVAHGYDSTGVAFPLAHYHNGFGEDSIQAENIAISDFLGGVELLLEASRSMHVSEPQTPDGAQSRYARLRTAPEEEGNRLRSLAKRSG